MPSILDRLRNRLFSRGDKEGLEQQQAQEVQPTVVDEGELISFVNNEFTRRMRERMPFENQWKLNINFLESNQYVDVNPVSQSIEEIPKAFDWQEREVFDMITPNVETRLARLSRMRPVLKVRPGSNEPDDTRSSKVGNNLLKNIYYDKKMLKKMGEALAWMESTGTVFLKHPWNPNLGRVIDYETITDESGQVIGQKEIREGDVDVDVCPPQEILPESCYRQDSRSYIHARGYHIDEIEEMYGKKVNPEQMSVMQMQRSMVGTGGLGYSGMTYNFTSLSMKDYAVVKEYWELPSKKHPNGRMIVVASGVLLFYLDHLPYLIGEDNKPGLPFTKLVCMVRPGCFFGKSVVEKMIPLQRRYNAVRNRKAEYMNRVGIGQWTVEDQSVDIEYMEENAGCPGAIIEHARGTAPPKPVQWAGLPAEFETEKNDLLQEFSIVSGVSEISRQSAAPSGVKSGVALQLALDQDDTRLSRTAQNVSDCLVESGQIWLRLYKQYAKGPRILRAIGKNNVVEMLDWTHTDIKSDDVIIEPYSAMVESPAQRKQMVFDLIHTGLFNEQAFSKEVRSKVLEIIELGNWEDLNSEDELHISKAERETLSMKQGIPMVPADFDDHVLHIARHNAFRLTVEYEQLAAQNPQVAAMISDHINIHMMGLQQIAAQQMRQQASMQKDKDEGQVA